MKFYVSYLLSLCLICPKFIVHTSSLAIDPRRLRADGRKVSVLDGAIKHALGDGGGGADIGPLRRVFPTTALGGLSPDSQRYFDIHHARNDVFENVNKRELELGAINMAALIYLIDKYGL